MFDGLLPDTSEGHLIKRVIGLPGDHVQCCDGEGRLLVNGTPIDEQVYLGPGRAGEPLEFNITVPEGHLWVMGDNRGHSHDSRMFGPIDEDLIVGRAFVKVWPLNKLGFL